MGTFKINERLKIVEDEYNDICYVINGNDAFELKLRLSKMSYFFGNECKVVGIITLNNFNNWYIVRPDTCEFNILLSEYNLVPLFKTKDAENIWKRLKRAKRKV